MGLGYFRMDLSGRISIAEACPYGVFPFSGIDQPFANGDIGKAMLKFTPIDNYLKMEVYEYSNANYLESEAKLIFSNNLN